MAKRKPRTTLVEMENELGYRLNPLNYLSEENRFYLDLRQIPRSIDAKTEKDFEKNRNQSYPKRPSGISMEIRNLGVVLVSMPT